MEKLNYYELYTKENFPEGPANSSTLTKMNFVDVLYERMGLSRAEAASVVEAVFSEIELALLEGRDVKLSNFGTFSARDKVARPGRNPKTGEEHEISARRVVSFTPAPYFRNAVESYQEKN